MSQVPIRPVWRVGLICIWEDGALSGPFTKKVPYAVFAGLSTEQAPQNLHDARGLIAAVERRSLRKGSRYAPDRIGKVFITTRACSGFRYGSVPREVVRGRNTRPRCASHSRSQGRLSNQVSNDRSRRRRTPSARARTKRGSSRWRCESMSSRQHSLTRKRSDCGPQAGQMPRGSVGTHGQPRTSEASDRHRWISTSRRVDDARCRVLARRSAGRLRQSLASLVQGRIKAAPLGGLILRLSTILMASFKRVSNRRKSSA